MSMPLYDQNFLLYLISPIRYKYAYLLHLKIFSSPHLSLELVKYFFTFLSKFAYALPLVPIALSLLFSSFPSYINETSRYQNLSTRNTFVKDINHALDAKLKV